MKIHIEHDWPLDSFKIWVVERFGNSTAVLRYHPFDGKVAPRWETDDESGARQEPTLILQEDVLRALLEEAGKIIPATHATERHLLREQEISDWLRARVEELLPE